MTNEIFFLATIAWIIGTVLFYLYCIIDSANLVLDESVPLNCGDYLVLDDEWLYLDSPAYPPYETPIPPMVRLGQQEQYRAGQALYQ